jgi:NAD-dependent oxidoreductase involved in siderophore biosynthesis
VECQRRISRGRRVLVDRTLVPHVKSLARLAAQLLDMAKDVLLRKFLHIVSSSGMALGALDIIREHLGGHGRRRLVLLSNRALHCPLDIAEVALIGLLRT